MGTEFVNIVFGKEKIIMNELIETVQNTESIEEAFRIMSVSEGHKAPIIRYSTTEDNVIMFNALNSASDKIENYIDQEVVVENIVVTAADVQEELNNPNAPYVNKPVIHFFLDDGTHIASLANGIRRTTMNLLALGFNPTPENPITIKFKSVKVKKGKAHGFDIISM